MANQTDTSATIDLDPAVLRFLLSSDYRNSIEAVRKNFRLTNDDVIFISDLDRLVLSFRLDLEAYMAALDDEFAERLSEEERDKMFVELLAERFVPFGDALEPSAKEVAKAEGLTLPPETGLRIELTPPQNTESLPKPVTKEALAIGQSKESVLESAVETIFARVSIRPEGEYLLKRLHNVISSRLRDVRSSFELRQLLTRDDKVGGLGFSPQQADVLAKEIEAGYTEFHDRITQEEKGKLDQEIDTQQRKVEERRRQEAEEHARWFEEKIRARRSEQTEQARVLGAAQQMIGTAEHPVERKERRLEAEKFGQLVPTPSGAQPVASVKVSPATIELAQTIKDTRPPMDAVRHVAPTPELMNLVDELQSVSVNEFRRMAKNPEDAAIKIRQKIETLGQESFEKKMQGVAAFHQSPLQAMYVALVGESLRSMRPVTEIADEKRKAGQPTLTPEEIAAIVQLNSALHY